MRNRKIIITIILFLCVITLNVLLFSVDKKTTFYSLNSEFESISVMVYDEDIDEYVKQNSIPTGDYELNEELSYCEGKGHIDSYDSELGKVTTKIKGSAKCYFYFDSGTYIYITKEFTYTGGEQTLTLPASGKVTIEAWGAQGGTYNSSYPGGYGGYSTGTINLEKGTTLYINVGGAGNTYTSSSSVAGGYNGGGSVTVTDGNSSSGGGATHVALVSGQLKNLSSHKTDNKIIIVAGGGGGANESTASGVQPSGGHGGGYTTSNVSGNSSRISGGTTIAYGANQDGPNSTTTYTWTNSGTTYTNAVGSFGQGGNAMGELKYSSAGGAGWYGGGSSFGVGGGAGGSGYIANDNLTNKKMVCYNCTTSNTESIKTESNTCVNAAATSDCSKIGNGYVKITYKNRITINSEFIFEYTGKEETFNVPANGIYKIEAWGASGGYALNETSGRGGYGAYSVGEITLTKGTDLYINVGGQGTNALNASSTLSGGYNGGGSCKGDGATGWGAGGGASHVALVSGILSTLSSHASDNKILIVASGGGGGGHYTSYNYGGHGGGIQGNNGNGNYPGKGGTQSSGGIGQSTNSYKLNGSFGQGGGNTSTPTSGGGGGYYGGGTGYDQGSGAGGGSGYIGNSNLKNKHMTCYSCTISNVESTKTNSNTCVNSQATSDCSKTGNGYIKITYMGNIANAEYSYTGTQEIYTVSKTGTYKLEVWGAQGGSYDNSKYGGYGAYSVGTINLTKNTKLYINVGGTTTTNTGGYNGGGNGSVASGQANAAIDKYLGGGGATHIALIPGLLSTLESNKNNNNILIVAGGGGGAYIYSSSFYINGGHGGGIQGNNGNATKNAAATGGTQSSGGIGNNNNSTYNGWFGHGGNGANGNDYSIGALGTGGGGGYYGGGGTYNLGSSSESGAGGSSYIANENLYDKHMTCYSCTTSNVESTYTNSNTCVNSDPTADCSKTGNGYVKITYLGNDSSSSIINSTSYNYIIQNNKSSLDNAAPTQNLYRYTGSYQSTDSSYAGNVDNYICLGNDAATCPAENMYRIIGIVASDDSTTGLEAGMIKVIKNTSIGQYKWDGGTNADDTSGKIYSSNYTSWRSKCNLTNNTSTTDTSSGCFPLWNESNLNINILNSTYLNSLSFKENIASVKWHCYVGDNPSLTNEYNSNLCSTASSKIGLMYVGDYLNSYNNGNTTASSTNKGWLMYCTDGTNTNGTTYRFNYNCYEWTISNRGFSYSDSNYYGWRAFFINHEGNVIHDCYYAYDWSYNAYRTLATRPVFYLKNSVTINSGTGTYANPFRVS